MQARGNRFDGDRKQFQLRALGEQKELVVELVATQPVRKMDVHAFPQADDPSENLLRRSTRRGNVSSPSPITSQSTLSSAGQWRGSIRTSIRKLDKLGKREIWQTLSEQGERIARLEEAVKGLDHRIDGLHNQVVAQGESLQAQINDLRQTIMGGFGILFAGMMGLIGFVLWDRRTALAPAIRNTEELRRVLQEYAKKEPKLAEAMKSIGLL